MTLTQLQAILIQLQAIVGMVLKITITQSRMLMITMKVRILDLMKEQVMLKIIL